MGYGKDLAQRIVQYMAEYDHQHLISETGCDGAFAIMEAYDETMGQLNNMVPPYKECWLNVAWYLVTQLKPTEGVQECEAYDLLEELFSEHGIG